MAERRGPKSGFTKYTKGMSVGGIDLEAIHDANAEAAKEKYYQSVEEQRNIPHLANLLARMGLANAATALAMVKDLEDRISRIEEKGVAYRGTFQLSDEYKRGDVVTFNGSAFHCARDVQGEYPHRTENGSRKNSDAWQLMVQRGRDAGPGGKR